MPVTHIVPIIKVTDIRASLGFYSAGLGFTQDFEFAAGERGPHYAGLSFGGHRLHLSSFPGDGVTGTATYCYVDDVDALHTGFAARGVAVIMEPTNQSWGMREVYVADPDGNVLRFGCPIEPATR